MDGVTKEQIAVLRRIGERGLKLAQSGALQDRRFFVGVSVAKAHEEHLDLWQHLLDELQRIKC